MGYLVLKPKDEKKPDTLDDIKTQLKETLENVTSNPP